MLKYHNGIYVRATFPTREQQEELLRPEPGEELTNSEMIALLRSGAESWNSWYAAMDHGVEIFAAKLSSAELQGVVLDACSLPLADLSLANLDGADLRMADFPQADFHGATLNGAQLEGTKLAKAKIASAQFSGATYNEYTTFPKDFIPNTAGMVRR